MLLVLLAAIAKPSMVVRIILEVKSAPGQRRFERDIRRHGPRLEALIGRPVLLVILDQLRALYDLVLEQHRSNGYGPHEAYERKHLAFHLEQEQDRDRCETEVRSARIGEYHRNEGQP